MGKVSSKSASAPGGPVVAVAVGCGDGTDEGFGDNVGLAVGAPGVTPTGCLVGDFVGTPGGDVGFFVGVIVGVPGVTVGFPVGDFVGIERDGLGDIVGIIEIEGIIETDGIIDTEGIMETDGIIDTLGDPVGTVLGIILMLGDILGSILMLGT